MKILKDTCMKTLKGTNMTLKETSMKTLKDTITRKGIVKFATLMLLLCAVTFSTAGQPQYGKKTITLPQQLTLPQLQSTTMDIETLRNYCLSLPKTSEYFPFDDTILAFRVANRIFAMASLENREWFVLKCDPDYAVRLRDAHPDITPAFHMNKRHWNQLNIYGSLPDDLIRSLVRHSYALVVAKLPKQVRQTIPENLDEPQELTI